MVSPLHHDALRQRVQDLVDVLFPISPAASPLSTNFTALCPLVPAESSAARRKREAAMVELQDGDGRRPEAQQPPSEARHQGGVHPPAGRQ